MLISRYENRWNPWKDLEALQNHLTGALGLSSTSTPLRASTDEKLQPTSWTPLVDVIEDEKEYLIKVEAPEVKKEDLTVKVQDGVLHVDGQRKFEREDEGRRFHRVERFYGRFSRSFALPDDADQEKVTAEFTDGILRVRVAKAEKAKPKQVEVRVA
ncbi:MAG: Hsp20/alpha crystallin family protein [Verrucomicrobia bacterium]|nr:Hsp20/alpha crystallin family protein [Verrucomicrobiota bacterium]MBI3870928.1 Hsp20/alpha crystallin family protein [Verrucomicrobiota bacterium]